MAFTDEIEPIVDEALVLDNLADAADISSARKTISVDDPESKISMEECVHHDTITELEDLKWKDCARKEDKRERKKRELNKVFVGFGGIRVVIVVFLGERGGRASEIDRFPRL